MAARKKKSTRKTSKSASKDVESAMSRRKKGTLKSGSGGKVTSKKQATPSASPRRAARARRSARRRLPRRKPPRRNPAASGLNRRSTIGMPAKPWAKANPKKKGAKKTLTPAQKAAAKRAAKTAGRPYPNLVDNMNAAKKAKKKKGKASK